MATDHVSRFYSLALGKALNFQAKTDGLIAAGDTTPDVSLNSLLWADTSQTLAITYFDNPTEGQIVLLGNLGSGGVNFSGANFYEQRSASIAQNEFASFVYHNSSWYELFRSQDRQDYDATVIEGSADSRWGGSSTGTFSIKGLRVVGISSAGKTIIKALSDGRAGQLISLYNNGAADVHICGCSGGSYGTFVTASCQTLVMPASASIVAGFNGTNWFIHGGTVVNLL